MYERLDKLRAEVERMKQRIEDDKARLKAAELKLKEAENSQIIADVSSMNLTPEGLARLLQNMASDKKMPVSENHFTFGKTDKEEGFEDE